MSLLIRDDSPGGDLSPRAEAKLIQDAAHMAVDRVLGYEQLGSDLLVAQPFSDRPRDLCSRLPSSLASALPGGAGAGSPNHIEGPISKGDPPGLFRLATTPEICVARPRIDEHEAPAVWRW